MFPRLRLACQPWSFDAAVDHVSHLFPLLVVKRKDAESVDYDLFSLAAGGSDGKSLTLIKDNTRILTVGAWLSFVDDLLPHLRTITESPEAYMHGCYWLSHCKDDTSCVCAV